MNTEDIRIDTFTSGTDISMRMIHIPTQIIVQGKGISKFRLQKKLFKELEEKVLKK